MHSWLLAFRDTVQSLPRWQRALYIFTIYAIAVAIISQTHGLVAGLLSAGSALALGYLLAKHDADPLANPRTFVDIQRPSARHLAVSLGGIMVILAVEFSLGIARAVLFPGSNVASHDVTTATNGQPGTLTIGLLVAAVVVAGPFIEELLFRNGIQKTLTSRVGAPLAIGLTSGVFALLHIPSYGGFAAPLTALGLPLVAIFASSCVFGAIYYYTGNVVVAFISHGGMNALALVVALS